MKKIIQYIKNSPTIRRFLRIFLSAFLVTGFTFVETFGGFNIIIKSFQINIGNGFNTIGTIFLLPLITSSTIAGFAAIGKYIRTSYPEIKNKLLKLVGNIF